MGKDVMEINPDAKYTVLDCEEYEKKYYVFDVLLLNGEDLMEKTYQDRLKVLEGYKLPKNCVMKEFFEIKQLTDLSIAFQRYYNDIKIDGVIINDMSKSYNKTKAYKLKDIKYLTNDFLIKLIDQKTLTSEEKKLINYKAKDKVYKLFCGGLP